MTDSEKVAQEEKIVPERHRKLYERIKKSASEMGWKFAFPIFEELGAAEASLGALASQQEAMRTALEKTSKFHRLDCSYMRDQRCQHCDCGKWEAEEVLAALSPQEPKQDAQEKGGKA